MDEVAAFAGLVDLARADIGGAALLCSDDFFAGMENLIRPEAAAFDPHAYTERGKLMDGWESRRRRTGGHDWCILRLGVPGHVRGVDIDTAFFLGNHPPFASIDACLAPPDTTAEELRDRAVWTRILDEAPLRRGSHNLQGIQNSGPWSHLRLNIYPDGGVARLRVYGDPAPGAGVPAGAGQGGAQAGEIDLAALVNGGRAVACSDMFFSPMNNLIMPGRSAYMGGGWETRRSRPPGEDWIIVALCGAGRVERLTLDTGHFKGNYPDRASVDGLYWPGAPPTRLAGHPDWKEIAPAIKLRADREIDVAVADPGPWTHLRLRILPDGGVARLRAWGRRMDGGGAGWIADDALLRHLNGLPEEEARAALGRCCGSRRWAEGMLESVRRAGPWQSRTRLLGEAEHIWWHLDAADWLEAFSHHPRIGADAALLRAKFAATAAWSGAEQAGMAAADGEVIARLAQGNADYEARFGFLFIVCATGLTAAEMLRRLLERLDNEPATELRIAAGEQAKITALRLAKLAPADRGGA